MDSSTYTIRKTFLIPLGLAVLLSFILLASALFLQLPTAKTIILAAFLLPVCVIFAESSFRKVSVTDDAIRVNKLFRSKRLSYAELTAIDTIQVRKRVFVSLSSEEDFMILSNSYDQFGLLLKQLLSKVPANVVSNETKQLAENPPKKCSDIYSAWLAVAVIALIIYVQLRGAF
ncbi:MAG: PH domain-containing protein [Desulfuromusa sp.]|nr:PH domain-containing protein [Desulfuromusa sp.]